MTKNHGLTAHQVDTTIMASELTHKHIGATIRFKYPNQATSVAQVIEARLASFAMTSVGVDVWLGDVGLTIPKLALTDSIHVEPSQKLLYALGLL